MAEIVFWSSKEVKVVHIIHTKSVLPFEAGLIRGHCVFMPQATLSLCEYQGMEEANWLLKVLTFLFSARFTFSRIMLLNFSYGFTLWGKGVWHIILPAIKVLSKKKKVL